MLARMVASTALSSHCQWVSPSHAQDNRSDSLDACTYGGLYCSVEPLPMGFTLPRTRCLHVWWPLLLCRAIANGFHPPTHKVYNVSFNN
ncbi:hypothetical protein DEO72_LG11g1875 [Vigna unguiculata]|uniref:Uncharacterized protein n=1 Tax=Vigna unguiculata TaxID=3917 RepID=A0A4D6NQT2_VIGUN|nr:hypothetical protein DEO72_LG11g1875 [Vigna unguiculata]